MRRRLLFGGIGGIRRQVAYIAFAILILAMVAQREVRSPSVWMSRLRMLAVHPATAVALLGAMIIYELFCGFFAFLIFRGQILPKETRGVFMGFKVIENSKTGKRLISLLVDDRPLIARYSPGLEQVLRGLAVGSCRIAVFSGAFHYVNRVEEVVG